MNLYAYCGNNPINKLDALGLKPQRIKGPKVSVVSYIPYVNPKDLNKESGAVPAEWFDTGYDVTLREYEAMKEIFKSGNSTPSDELDWAKLRESKDYRNYTSGYMSIRCCNGKITSNDFKALPVFINAVGYTPVAGVYFSGDAEFKEDKPEVNATGDCVSIHTYSKFRLGALGRGANWILTGNQTPWAWVDITYQVCCNKTASVVVKASNIPSHLVYLNDNVVGGSSMIMDMKRSDLVKFMQTAEGDATGGSVIKRIRSFADEEAEPFDN